MKRYASSRSQSSERNLDTSQNGQLALKASSKTTSSLTDTAAGLNPTVIIIHHHHAPVNHGPVYQNLGHIYLQPTVSVYGNGTSTLGNIDSMCKFSRYLRKRSRDSMGMGSRLRSRSSYANDRHQHQAIVLLYPRRTSIGVRLRYRTSRIQLKQAVRATHLPVLPTYTWRLLIITVTGRPSGLHPVGSS